MTTRELDTLPAASWAEMAKIAAKSAQPNGPEWDSFDTLADAVENALDEAGEDTVEAAKETQRQADAEEFEAKRAELAEELRAKVVDLTPLEEAARELLADYEQAMDLVHVKDTRASVRMRQVLLDLDIARTR